MGDRSSAGNSTLPADDPQYEADLELAKRLSLESYETEKWRRNVNDSKFQSQPTTWSRANSSTAQGDRTSSFDGQNANTPAGSNPSPGTAAIIRPPPSNAAVKRQRSLPHRGRGQTQDPNVIPENRETDSGSTTVPNNSASGKEIATGSSLMASDDLILLASPQVTPKFTKRDASGACQPLFASFSTMNNNSNYSGGSSPSVTSPSSSSPFIPGNSGRANSTGTAQPSTIYPNMLSGNHSSPTPTIGFNISPSAGFGAGSFATQSAIPFAERNPVTSGWNNIPAPAQQMNTMNTRQVPLQGPSPQIITTTNIPNNNDNDRSNGKINGFASSTRQVLPLGDDLIDLGGQFDSKKILEFFDPLLSPEQSSENNSGMGAKPNDKSPPTVPERASLPTSSSDYSRKSNATKSDNTNGAQRHSLYPDLSEAAAAGTLNPNCHVDMRSESPYSTLQKQLLDFDEASIYDTYNPLEYLYAVSCSSASSTVASEFYYATTNSLEANIKEGSIGGGSENNGETRSIGFSHYLQDSVSINSTSTESEPPELPPRNHGMSKQEPEVYRRVRNSNVGKERRSCSSLYENLESVKQHSPFDSEIQAFYEMLRETRLSCRHIDSTTNRGYIYAATFPTKTLAEGFSVKVKVWNEAFTRDPVTFVCDVSSSIEHVLEQSLLDLGIQGSGRDFILRVYGLNEYLCPDVPVSDFRYVQECIKLDQDVRLILVHRSTLEKKNWARTPRDDSLCLKMDIDSILPGQPPKAITYAEISRFLDVIDREAEKIRDKLKCPSSGSSTTSLQKETTSLTLNTAPLIQPVKGVCVLLGNIQTVDIKNSLDLFSKACDEWNSKLRVSSPIDPNPEPRRRLKIGSDVSNRYSVVDLSCSPRESSGHFEGSARDVVINALDQVEESVKILVEMYSKSFPVSFKMKKDLHSVSFRRKQGSGSTANMSDSFLLRVGAVHRLNTEWLSTYMDYFLGIEVFHGSLLLAKAVTDSIVLSKKDNNLFFTSLVFDSWVIFEHMPLCILPRESRLVFTLMGRRKPPDEKSEALEIHELGWASIQCFNFKGQFVQGNYILPFWPKGLIQKRLGPAPNPMTSSDINATLISIEFTDTEEDIFFPEIPSAVPLFRDFASLDDETQQLLKHIIENCTFAKLPAEDREILWEKRHYLYKFANALPKVLLSANLWDYASLAEIHAMLRHWAPVEPIEALQLLLPCFPDGKVREQCITWLSEMDNEDLVNMLPQLIEALSYETFDLSPLAEFLIRKSISCLKISHAMFWLLVSQVGLGKWAQEFEGIVSTTPAMGQAGDGSEMIFDPKRRRLELMLNSLMISCGEKWKSALIAEYRMIDMFSDIATQVKNAPSSSRNEVLVHELHKMDVLSLNGSKTFPLPMSPSFDIRGIEAQTSHSFNSASVPIKINFTNALPEGGTIPMLFKKGDDLRQDMLTLQIIRVIEKMWLKEGTDFRVLTFSCNPTGYKQGVVEMVPNSETLCKIQAEYGLTGAFQDRPIADWLAKMNQTSVEYKLAVENFTLTCAAYCVLTYILGICDRHNDNIMLTTSGHLFHIDFGKFLGDTQRFGTFKRDRTPFVLTSDMVYVINDGEKSSHRFQRFVELCCQAFRIVRQNGNVLVNLFALMATAGIPGVDLKSVTFVQNALLPDCSNAEASATFTRFIEDSLRNWFTPVNFFIHSLGQLKFLNETPDNPNTLSFVQKIYSMEEDGRIICANIIGFKKHYDPEKYYSYLVEVKREGVGDSFILNRSYKEFYELYTKLCASFPMITSNLKCLPKGAGLGRTNVKQVAERRKINLQLFLGSLFQLAPEVSHSNLVYTFFHPLLRDEEPLEDGEEATTLNKSATLTPARIHGRIKISLEYSYIRSALCVLILHAVDLACPNGQPPSPYVKTYLMPDISRVTKRKTRVVRRSQFPTFMEMIEYRLPLDVLRSKTLQLSVWHYDPLQENNFLGGVSIPLDSLTPDKEIVMTYTLGNINLSM